jgi:hypothetical protein
VTATNDSLAALTAELRQQAATNAQSVNAAYRAVLELEAKTAQRDSIAARDVAALAASVAGAIGEVMRTLEAEAVERTRLPRLIVDPLIARSEAFAHDLSVSDDQHLLAVTGRLSDLRVRLEALESLVSQVSADVRFLTAKSLGLAPPDLGNGRREPQQFTHDRRQ